MAPSVAHTPTRAPVAGRVAARAGGSLRPTRFGAPAAPSFARHGAHVPTKMATSAVGTSLTESSFTPSGLKTELAARAARRSGARAPRSTANGSISAMFGGLFKGPDPSVATAKKYQPQVDAINALESKFKPLSDDELRAKTAEFQKRARGGEDLNSLLPEAFAVRPPAPAAPDPAHAPRGSASAAGACGPRIGAALFPAAKAALCCADPPPAPCAVP